GGGTVDVSVIFKMNGKLEIVGEVSDYVEATDLTMTMKASASSANEGSNVTLTMNGAIETSAGSYTYSNETIAVVAGELPKA
ncbi:MAG TPA: hypothetical protein VLQ93_23000, partial [Myxococcaceae bacterium]|nr:hypothetical protein [Myxococcaceae bacterium]